MDSSQLRLSSIKILKKLFNKKYNIFLMKSTIILLGAFLALGLTANAQLYSSGNNVITGNSVGIGTNTPQGKLHVFTNTGNQEHVRMQNTNPTGWGKFIMYNDITSNYANFTKYGSAVTGGYSGITTLFPYANLFAFGNNNGPSLFSNSGNIGINALKGGVSNLKFFVDYSTLRVGIGGNATPAAKIHFNTSATNDTVKYSNASTGHGVNDGLDIRNIGRNVSIVNCENNSLSFGTNNTNRMMLDSLGNLIVGSVSRKSGYKLFVETGILTEKVKVAVKTSAEWSDYVFDPEYKLPSIKDVETFVTENKHLPNVPNAEQMVTNGLDVAKMDAKLLEKIEELTLYIIQLNNRIEKLESENKGLKENK
jgi:hypothetical protein